MENQKPSIQEVLNAALRMLQDIANWEGCWPGTYPSDDAIVSKYMLENRDWERKEIDA